VEKPTDQSSITMFGSVGLTVCFTLITYCIMYAINRKEGRQSPPTSCKMITDQSAAVPEGLIPFPYMLLLILTELNWLLSVVPEDLVPSVSFPEVEAQQHVVRPPPLPAGRLQQRLGTGVESALAERLEHDAVRGHDGLGVAVEPVEREGQVPREPALHVRVDEASVCDEVRRNAVAAHVVGAEVEVPEHAHLGEGRGADVERGEVRPPPSPGTRAAGTSS
jgi:hypothetical protein